MGTALPIQGQESGEAWGNDAWRPRAPLIEEAQAREAEIIPFDSIRPAQIAEAQAGVDAALASIPDSEHERVQIAMNDRSDNNNL